MLWVGSFQSLQSVLTKPRFSREPLEVHTWLRSEIGLLSAFVDWLMSLIAGTGCLRGKEELVELAFGEPVRNGMIPGNRLVPRGLVHVRWDGECTDGLSIV